MPLITIHVFPELDDEQKAGAALCLAQTVRRILGTDIRLYSVSVEDVSEHNCNATINCTADGEKLLMRIYRGRTYRMDEKEFLRRFEESRPDTGGEGFYLNEKELCTSHYPGSTFLSHKSGVYTISTEMERSGLVPIFETKDEEKAFTCFYYKIMVQSNYYRHSKLNLSDSYSGPLALITIPLYKRLSDTLKMKTCSAAAGAVASALCIGSDCIYVCATDVTRKELQMHSERDGISENSKLFIRDGSAYRMDKEEFLRRIKEENPDTGGYGFFLNGKRLFPKKGNEYEKLDYKDGTWVYYRKRRGERGKIELETADEVKAFSKLYCSIMCEVFFLRCRRSEN